MDLIVRRAQLQDRPCGEWVDIGIADGLIHAIAPRIDADAPVFDAAGRLTCAGLVETHIHLDKSRLLGRCPAEPGRAINPVRYVEAFKPEISEEDIYERAEATLRECLLHGTTRIRTHVEIDPKIGLRGHDALARLARDYAWAVDLQLCVFPQDGLTNVPGTDELLVETLERGARVIGGAPRYDTDAPAQIRRIFELAQAYDCDVDLHLDVGPTADHLDVHLVAELTEAHGLGGRVTVGPRWTSRWSAVGPTSRCRSTSQSYA
jgi:cytosine/creatinine deaminase